MVVGWVERSSGLSPLEFLEKLPYVDHEIRLRLLKPGIGYDFFSDNNLQVNLLASLKSRLKISENGD